MSAGKQEVFSTVNICNESVTFTIADWVEMFTQMRIGQKLPPLSEAELRNRIQAWLDICPENVEGLYDMLDQFHNPPRLL